MATRSVYRFTNRRTAREAIRQLRRNFPGKDRLHVGVVVQEGQKILVQASLHGKSEMHEEIFMEGILSAGKKIEMTKDEFAGLALEAPECYLGAAALAFPLCRPGERLGDGHVGRQGPHGQG